MPIRSIPSASSRTCRSRWWFPAGCTTCRKWRPTLSIRGAISASITPISSGSNSDRKGKRRGMFRYIVYRLAIMVPTLLVISFVVFVIIQAPPGDYLSTYIAELQSQGSAVDPSRIAALRAQYGLDQPFLVQYATWVMGLLHGDMGYSFEYGEPVSQLVGDRLLLTMV